MTRRPPRSIACGSIRDVCRPRPATAGVIEHLFVTAGIVSVGPLGNATEVPAGSDVSWESATPHSYAAVGDEIAEALLMMRHPAPPAAR